MGWRCFFRAADEFSRRNCKLYVKKKLKSCSKDVLLFVFKPSSCQVVICFIKKMASSSNKLGIIVTVTNVEGNKKTKMLSNKIIRVDKDSTFREILIKLVELD